MAIFTLRGLVLDVPAHALRGGLQTALETGRYEHAEADALTRHLRPGDRMVDLGAGAGYLCCLAARVIGAGAVAGIEASEEMAGVARANLARNGLGAAEVVHAAVVGPGHVGPRVDFGLRPAFWASALVPPNGQSPRNAQTVSVPAVALVDVLGRFRPSVLTCDIEGAEAEVLAAPLTPDLRLIVVEVHPQFYGLAGTKRVFDGLSAQGFAFSPEGSRGSTVVFERLT